ncbi:hypothetical protein HHUSO_G9503 [Huso huso]|uniref:Uncharacterized protein n=1 Tax=Huso huso TaxID=61971 RepID=A0ABR0ZTJ2_HUSHU
MICLLKKGKKHNIFITKQSCTPGLDFLQQARGTVTFGEGSPLQPIFPTYPRSRQPPVLRATNGKRQEQGSDRASDRSEHQPC